MEALRWISVAPALAFLLPRAVLSCVAAFALFAPTLAVAGYGESSYYGESPYYSQTYYQGGYYFQGSYQLTFTGDVSALADFSVANAISKAFGTFVIDHPLDPKNKLLFHSFVESPEVKNLYDGVATLDKSGEAIVNLPSYFEALNKDFRYQLKPIGKPMPNLYIKEEVKNNRFTIAGGEPNGRVSWQVTGNRHDPFILANPLQVEVSKGPGELVNVGEYLFPEAYEQRFGLTAPLGSLLRSIADLFGNLLAR
ncbi:hypothetical protein A3A39_02325 [Candidatus Kaiserbacteria bacterium RIFCSPLOWO2_01_FULL_54_13]|uniref:Uncharacterized protein n=1 Tax=Candidatus Kaiserbacteria bacterium RIFCSPLOWO2_01_FULL_54_13 TaxID=1798512 RepID=A0A1F6F1D0_9BACT|nr:MAG: hypothetical protein A3A39_02325 [Candidatus Kaiserbacteria bacterium RIFCSPLOWO2_01_FULL_54_13]